jgi:hypothetical protein
MHLRSTWLAAAVLLLVPALSTHGDTLPGSSLALSAVALCNTAVEEHDPAARLAALDRGLTLAEAALEANDADAAAHFAVFCNLGRRLQLRPVSWGSLTGIRRVRHEIDRALALVPDSPSALTATGVMLLELPRLLGGDAGEGARLLRRALALEPSFAPAQRALVEHAGR